MKFDTLITQVGELPFFDVPLLVQVADSDKRRVVVQLYQWCRQGKVLRLRRGMYTLADRYRKAPLSPLRLANDLYRPSYVSGPWALSFYGLIPEKVTHWTSVTPRVTRTFQNALGTFTYSSLSQKFFWGFGTQLIDGSPVWIAEPEKAVLDTLHLAHGEWTEARVHEMRFQAAVLDWNKLSAYAKRWASPRLVRAVERLDTNAHTRQEGDIEL